MKSKTLKLISVILAAIAVLGCCVTGFAESSPFLSDAYATVVTASDFQNVGSLAYERFASIVSLAKSDGMPTPDSLLVGGDYTLLLGDYAPPKIAKIRARMNELYPEFKPESAVFIQGNHDISVDEFTKTGFYDMGAFCLYAIDEDSFPWKQGDSDSKEATVKATADDIDAKLAAKSASGDTRPVFVITHVPLHYTTRNGGADNSYAPLIFNVLKKWAESTDIVFLFGHNHSGEYDDYIGGSVNFMKSGDTIRIPDASNGSYKEETLNFTYTNCGYVGTSHNTVSDTSTNIFTVGVIQLSESEIRFLKYNEKGVYKTFDIERVVNSTETKQAVYPGAKIAQMNAVEKFFDSIMKSIFTFILRFLNENTFFYPNAVTA